MIAIYNQKNVEYGPYIYKKPTGVGDRWSYAAGPGAEDSTFYEFEGDWFYIVKDRDELLQLRESGPWLNSTWLNSTNPNLRVDITDKNGLTKSIPMNNLIITRLDDIWAIFMNVAPFNQVINNWDTSNVYNMSSLFSFAQSFNQDISGWDVSGANHMESTFYHATNFNQDLSGWCVELIRNRPFNFNYNTPQWTLPKPKWGTCPSVPSDSLVFEKPTGVGNRWSYAIEPEAWDSTFYEYEGDWFYVVKDRDELNQLKNSGDWLTSTDPNLRVDITDKWNVTKSIPMNHLITTRITSMEYLFEGSSFNQFIGNWDVSGVAYMVSTFYNSPFNQDIGGWDVSGVSDTNGMFNQARAFNQDIGGWDVSGVSDMDFMLYIASSFNQDLSMWCVEQIPNEPSGFDLDTPVWTLPKPVWGTCPSVPSVPLVFEKPTGVGDKWSYAIEPGAEDSTFYEYEGDWFYVVKDSGELNQLKNSGDWLTSTDPNLRVDITDVNNLTKSIPMNNLIMTRVTDISWLFWDSGFNQDIGKWDVSNVVSMEGAFNSSSVFDQDIGGWDVSSLTNTLNMFGDSVFNKPIGNWDVRNVTEMRYMFYGSMEFNQDLSSWCVSHIQTQPEGFDGDTPNWILPKPVWGTCP